MNIAVWSYSWRDQKPCLDNKTNVQIMKFTCCLNMDFELLRWALLCLRYVEDVTFLAERSILEFYNDVRGSLRNWCHCKQHSELATMLVCCRIWRVYMEFWSFRHNLPANVNAWKTMGDPYIITLHRRWCPTGTCPLYNFDAKSWRCIDVNTQQAQHLYNVASTSMQRHDIAPTLIPGGHMTFIQRRLDVV